MKGEGLKEPSLFFINFSGGEFFLEPITIDTFLKLIGQVGFPIVVATYLLLRTNGKMDKLKDVILELKEAVNLLKEELQRRG